MKKSRNYKYYVNLYWDERDKIFVAEIPELLGCATHGYTKKEAIENVEDAIATWLDGAKESHYPIPEPLATKKHSGKFNLRIRPELHGRLSLKAMTLGKSLNSYVCDILGKAMERP